VFLLQAKQENNRFLSVTYGRPNNLHCVKSCCTKTCPN